MWQVVATGDGCKAGTLFATAALNSQLVSVYIPQLAAGSCSQIVSDAYGRAEV
jgi:hypothetical protein